LVGQEKAYLQKASPAHEAVQKVVNDKRLLSALKKCKLEAQTSQLESFHSVLRVYAPKRQAFPFDGTLVRSMLAAIDHNFNTGRQGTGLHSFSFSKRSKRWVAKERMEPKDHTWRAHLIERALSFRSGRLALSSTSYPWNDTIPVNIAPEERPDKAQLVRSLASHQRTRTALK
jgi:solute carrier family 8 (sodium/calcium exchanger)